MAVIIWEEPVAVGNRYMAVEVTFTICVRLVPNIGGVLNKVLEVEGVQISVVLGLETINAVLALSAVMLEFEITVLRLEMPEIVQDVGEPVIRMIPELTSLLY